MRWPLALTFALAAMAVPPRASVPVELEVFTRQGCPRCEDARAFLEALQRERPDVRVVYRHVDQDPAARDRLATLSREAGITVPSVPAFHVEGRLLVGFAGEAISGPRILALLEGAAPPGIREEGLCRVDEPAPCAPPPVPDEIDAGRWGSLRASRLGLPLFTLVVGLLDGFNPCAMWVLLFLLSMLVNLHDRRKMALVAGVFVLVSGAAYLAFMAAWLNVFLLMGWSRAVQVVLAVVAGLVGALNVKDCFAWGRGISASIPERAKPTIYARTRAILQAENLPAALVAVAGLAVLVNMVELLCTAGLPAIYTSILASHGLPRWQYVGYLLLYIFAYMVDDAVMVGIAVVTLSRARLQERHGRILKLISGTVMLLLAGLLMFRPGWLR
ncbi:MAG: glutaredoxin domain-containing protein [Myxococcota bacterium]